MIEAVCRICGERLHRTPRAAAKERRGCGACWACLDVMRGRGRTSLGWRDFYEPSAERDKLVELAGLAWFLEAEGKRARGLKSAPSTLVERSRALRASDDRFAERHGRHSLGRFYLEVYHTLAAETRIRRSPMLMWLRFIYEMDEYRLEMEHALARGEPKNKAVYSAQCRRLLGDVLQKNPGRWPVGVRHPPTRPDPASIKAMNWTEWRAYRAARGKAA